MSLAAREPTKGGEKAARDRWTQEPRVLSAHVACTCGLPSLRPVKLRLNDVMIEFFVPFLTSWRSHWPMQGPHAFERTTPLTFSNVLRRPASQRGQAPHCLDDAQATRRTQSCCRARSSCEFVQSLEKERKTQRSFTRAAFVVSFRNTRRDGKVRLDFDGRIFGERLLDDRGRARHVFVRRVGARANQRHFELQRRRASQTETNQQTNKQKQE